MISATAGVTTPQPETFALPTLRFRLPGDWWAVSLRDRDAALASAKRLVRHRVGTQDDRAALRARLVRDFGLAIDEAITGGGQQLLIAIQIVETVPLPITIAVYLPDLDLVPAIGTRAEAVLDVLEQGLDAREGSDADRTRVDAAGAPAIREHRIRVVEAGADSDRGTIETLVADYWLPVPARKRVVLVSVSTPFAQLQEAMLQFFDAILRASYWQSAEGHG
ncbi:hypothetical protein EV141_0695 [Microcella putealis]|uniref:Uncharacterized protein n=1 Tax=Microcella putealis TaxID=337005 RepID=A0A4Q7M075_9MICO|nr:hypothetical protein [Microcella putealis]RZS59469.1 hypothetical protein EV141_0695 [Microcella putealis]TQM20094.1 hypothetical protein BJ957_2232 [Microcella putealis]